MKKKMNNEGFTLAELLIVVAIIAILVAVSIPIFVWQLEKSRESTDLANMRAAKAEAAAVIMAVPASDNADYDVYKALMAGTAVYYDADNGVLLTSAPSVKYGKGTDLTGASDNTAMGYKPGESYENKVVKISYAKATNKFTISWG